MHLGVLMDRAGCTQPTLDQVWTLSFSTQVGPEFKI